MAASITCNQRDSGYRSRRAVAFIAIVVLHGLAIWVLANGIARSGARYQSAVLQTRLLPLDKPRETPPPPPVTLAFRQSAPLTLVAPDITIADPVDPPPPPLQSRSEPRHTDETAAVDAAPEAAPGSMTMPRPLTRPHGPDRYPRESFLARETGRTTIRICISATGAVDSVEVASTSGFPRLDRAAVSIGLDYRFRPAMLQGRAVPVCLPYGIKFGINNL
jgi:protein TonB